MASALDLAEASRDGWRSDRHQFPSGDTLVAHGTQSDEDNARGANARDAGKAAHSGLEEASGFESSLKRGMDPGPREVVAGAASAL